MVSTIACAVRSNHPHPKRRSPKTKKTATATTATTTATTATTATTNAVVAPKTYVWTFPMRTNKPTDYDALRAQAPDWPITLDALGAFGEAYPVDTSGNARVYAKHLFAGKPADITSARVPDDVKRAANQRDDVLYFTSFCASHPEFAGLVVGASQRSSSSLSVTLKTDMFLLWDATHAWSEHRKACIEHTSALDNGWYRHAARLMARLQKHELYEGKQDWWVVGPASNGGFVEGTTTSASPPGAPLNPRRFVSAPEEVAAPPTAGT